MPQRHARTGRSFSRSSRSRAAPRSPQRSSPDELLPLLTETVSGLVTIGRIVRPHGLRGFVVVHAAPSALEILRPGLPIAIVDQRGVARASTVRQVTHRGDTAIVELEGVSDRDAAFCLAGRVVSAAREHLPPISESERYECDVIGLSVYSPVGDLLGILSEILATGANDVWVVRGATGEILVPAVAHAVLDVDIAGRRAVIDPAAAMLPEK